MRIRSQRLRLQVHLYEGAEMCRCDHLFENRETLSYVSGQLIKTACYDRVVINQLAFSSQTQSNRRDDAPLSFRRIEFARPILTADFTRDFILFNPYLLCCSGMFADLSGSFGESTSVTFRSLELHEMSRPGRARSAVEMSGLPYRNPRSSGSKSRHARGLGGKDCIQQ